MDQRASQLQGPLLRLAQDGESNGLPRFAKKVDDRNRVVQIELLLEYGPKKLHLHDLEDVEIIYRKVKPKVKSQPKQQVEQQAEDPTEQNEQQNEQQDETDGTGDGGSAETNRNGTGSPSDATTPAASASSLGKLRRSGRSTRSASTKNA